MTRAIHLLVYSCLLLQIAECGQRKTWSMNGKLQRKMHPYKSTSTIHNREPDKDIYGEITPNKSPPKDYKEDYDEKGEDEEEPAFFYVRHPGKGYMPRKKQSYSDYIINKDKNGKKWNDEGEEYEEIAELLKRGENLRNLETVGGGNEAEKINPLKRQSSLIERQKKHYRGRDHIKYRTQDYDENPPKTFNMPRKKQAYRNYVISKGKNGKKWIDEGEEEGEEYEEIAEVQKRVENLRSAQNFETVGGENAYLDGGKAEKINPLKRQSSLIERPKEHYRERDDIKCGIQDYDAYSDYIINKDKNGKKWVYEGEEEGEEYEEIAEEIKRGENLRSAENIGAVGGENEYLDGGKAEKIHPLKRQSSLIERPKKHYRGRDDIKYDTQPVSDESNSQEPYFNDHLPEEQLVNSIPDYEDLDIHDDRNSDYYESTELNYDPFQEKIKYKNKGDVRPQDVHVFLINHEDKTWQSEEQRPLSNFELNIMSKIKNIEEAIKDKESKGIIPLTNKEKVQDEHEILIDHEGKKRQSEEQRPLSNFELNIMAKIKNIEELIKDKKSKGIIPLTNKEKVPDEHEILIDNEGKTWQSKEQRPQNKFDINIMSKIKNIEELIKDKELKGIIPLKAQDVHEFLIDNEGKTWQSKEQRPQNKFDINIMSKIKNIEELIKDKKSKGIIPLITKDKVEDVDEFLIDHEGKTWQSEEKRPQNDFELNIMSKIKHVEEVIKDKESKGIIPLITKVNVRRSQPNQRNSKSEMLAKLLNKKMIKNKDQDVSSKIAKVNKNTNESDHFRISEHNEQNNSTIDSSSEKPTKAIKQQNPKEDKSALFPEIGTYKSSMDSLVGRFQNTIASYARDFETFVPYLVPNLNISYDSKEVTLFNLSKSSYNSRIICEYLFAKQEALDEAYSRNLRNILFLYSPGEMDVRIINLIVKVSQTFGAEQAVKKEISALRKTSVYKLNFTWNFSKENGSGSFNQSVIAPAFIRRAKQHIRKQVFHHIPNLSEIRQQQRHLDGYDDEGKSKLISALAKHNLFSLMIYKNLHSLLRHLDSLLRSFSEIDDHHHYIKKRSVTEKDIQGYTDEDHLYDSPTNRSTKSILEEEANYYGQYVAKQVITDFTVYVQYLYKHMIDAVRADNPQDIEVDPSQLNDIISKRLRPIIVEKMEELPQPTRRSQEDLKRMVMEEIHKKSLIITRNSSISYIKEEITTAALKLKSYIYQNEDISTQPSHPSSNNNDHGLEMQQPSQVPLYEYAIIQDNGLPFYSTASLRSLVHNRGYQSPDEESRPTEEWNYLAQLMRDPRTPPLDTIEPIIETVVQKESYQVANQLSLEFTTEVKYVCEYPFTLIGENGKSNDSESILFKIVRKRIVEHIKHSLSLTRILNKMGIEEYNLSETLRQEFTYLVYSTSTSIAVDTINSVLKVESTKLLQYISTTKTNISSKRSSPNEVYDYPDNMNSFEPPGEQTPLGVKVTKQGFTIGGTKFNLQEDIVKPAKAILGSLNSNRPPNDIFQCNNRENSHILSYIGAKLLEDLIKSQDNQFAADNLDVNQKLSAILSHYYLTKKSEEKSSYQTYERETDFTVRAKMNYTDSFQIQEDSEGDKGESLGEDRGMVVNDLQKYIDKLERQPTEQINYVSTTHGENKAIDSAHKSQTDFHSKYKPNVSVKQPYFNQNQKSESSGSKPRTHEKIENRNISVSSSDKSLNINNKGTNDKSLRVRLLEPIYEFVPEIYQPSSQHLNERNNYYDTEGVSDPADKWTSPSFQKLHSFSPDPAVDATVLNDNYNAGEVNYYDQLDSEPSQPLHSKFPSNINSMSKYRDSAKTDNYDSDLPSPVTKWGTSSFVQQKNPPPLQRDNSIRSSLNFPLGNEPAIRKTFVNDKVKNNTNHEEKGQAAFKGNSQTSNLRSIMTYDGDAPNWHRSKLKYLDKSHNDDHYLPPQDTKWTSSGEEQFIRYPSYENVGYYVYSRNTFPVQQSSKIPH